MWEEEEQSFCALASYPPSSLTSSPIQKLSKPCHLWLWWRFHYLGLWCLNLWPFSSTIQMLEKRGWKFQPSNHLVGSSDNQPPPTGSSLSSRKLNLLIVQLTWEFRGQRIENLPDCSKLPHFNSLPPLHFCLPKFTHDILSWDLSLDLFTVGMRNNCQSQRYSRQGRR